MTVIHVQKVSGVSGSEAHLLDVLPRLRDRGVDARMVVLHEGEPGAGEFGGLLRGAGVPVEELRLRRDVDPAAFARLVRLLRRERPRVVHTHLVHADAYGLPAARLARVPATVSTKHGFNAFRESRAFAAADRALARLATANVAISQGLADYLAATEGFAAGSFRIVHYGIEAGAEPPAPPREPRLAAVGRLIPVKGFDVLLEAFAAARKELPELTLELAGDGPLRAELERAAPGGVTFLGRVSPVAPLYERSLAAVVPSRGEGFGMVALEAMERGRAVIGSRVGGLPELVEDGVTGLLVPPDDPEALAHALQALGGNPARAAAMGAAGRARALAAFGADRPAEALDALYRTLAA
ncbi:MAG TPA: glycosyltransferase family 4 protein [Gaiellaceae bacterium]|jgi:glycosyltransferase involved in cell wall biosynthesis|nr:glycosyltransferase family 4 protein [Gaiellaceae bacterium]